MINFITYLIQVCLVFTILFLTFKLVLNKLTFHGLNRLVLLTILPLSLVIPFTDLFFSTVSSRVIDIPVFEKITEEKLMLLKMIPTPKQEGNYFLYFLFSLYLIGVLIKLIGFVKSILKLFLLKKKSIVYPEQKHLIIVADVHEIFSFLNYLFIPKNQINECDELIIEHEKTHMRLKHSIDLILTEIYSAFFWFNPFIYLYRKSLKLIHEYQTDKCVLNIKGVKTSSYLKLLLNGLEIKKTTPLYNYFNNPMITKRVEMMNKKTSISLAKMNYSALLAIVLLCMLSFTKPDFHIPKTILPLVTVSPPSIFPVKGTSLKDITSHFGKRKQKFHHGIDVRAQIGTPVLATSDGIIAHASLKGNWGNLIVITHANGYETWYAHLNSFNSKVDQKVKAGDIIGYTGNTGRSSGPHLHYEVKLNGKNLNPINFLKSNF